MLSEKVLRKHVAIIHAYSLMSVLQRKIVNVLLYEATKDSENIHNEESALVERRISFSSLCKAIKFNSNNTQYLKESIDQLASLKIEWNLLRDKLPTDISFLNLRVLHGSPTFYQDGTLNYSFHKVMLDLVKNPSIYGTLNIDTQCEFESKYSHALYENSTRFVNLHKNKTIQLDTFRKMLGVNSDKYPTMREFTRNVILPSVEEVNDRADFIVSLENVKQGRKITGFTLLVEDNKKSKPSNAKNFIEDSVLKKEMTEIFGMINKRVFEDIVINYSEEYIRDKINYTKKHVKKDGFGYYPIAYFISALKGDYRSISETPSENLKKNDPIKEDLNVKLDRLHSDINHWKKMLQYANKKNNTKEIENIKNIILNYERDLQFLLDETPKKEAVL